MAGESQRPPGTAPDPTDQTTAQLDRGLESERDYVDGKIAALDQRIASMDVATKLLNETINRVPTDLQTAMANVKEVFDIRLKAEREIAGVHQQYRLELKADADKALTAALAAAEKRAEDARVADAKARDAQIVASQLATDKTEKTFKDALAQQQETFTVAIANVVEGLAEAKGGVSDIRSEQRGGLQSRTAAIAFLGVILTILVIAGIIAGMLAARPG